MSGQATALAEAKKLKAVMARHGVQASIELQVGRPWAGDDWYSQKHALINHHTAGARTGLTPSLALVKRGRGTDLPGPLCNGYGGRDFIYRIICMGLANHPGAGGPITLAGFTVPKDSARISTWGTEWEHDGVSPWPADMQSFMGRANAALVEYLDIPVARSIEHSTWAPRRKIDRYLYTAESGQREIKTWAGAVASTTKPKPEDDVELDDTIKLTAAQARAMNLNLGPTDTKFKENDPVKVARLLVWGGPGIERLYSQAQKANSALAALQLAVTAQGKALAGVVANSPDAIKAAGEEFVAKVRQELADIDVHVSLGDPDDAPVATR